MELLITMLVVVVVCYLFYWLAGKLPAPINQIAQIIVIAGGAIWLVMNIRNIIHAIAGAGS